MTGQPAPAPGSDIALRRVGSGPPLVLLHALGLSSHTWAPVLPALAARFEVITVDLPGFGLSPALPAGTRPTPAALAAAVADALDAADVRVPHVVGNSIGGWVALELARLRPLASLTLLSPAGMWPEDTPAYCALSLRATRWLAVHAPAALGRLVDHRAGRVLVLGQSRGRPTRMTPAQAREDVDAVATSTGFEATLAETAHLRFRARPDDARAFPPVTVAYGSRDRVLLRRRWRGTAELPPGTTVRSLPGCGHVPMADDPAAVAEVIATAATLRPPLRAVRSSR
jgi:pimeloyl-ACP methyl ester carboxylesterase